MKIAIATFWSVFACLAVAGPCCAGAPAAEPLATPKEPGRPLDPSPPASGYPAGAPGAPLHFRRVYVPEGTTDWPKGNVKYLPMDAAEFDRLLGAIQRTAPGLPADPRTGAPAAGFVRAEYECRLKGRSVLQGSGTLDVSPAVSSSTFVTLDPCNLAIDRARWVTSDGAPAVMGMSGDGRVHVLAERGGQMKFDWSLAGHDDDAGDPLTGGVSFAISLPPSAVSLLRIEAPSDLLPSVDRGIITEEHASARATERARNDHASATAPEPGFRRWNIELGGFGGVRLRLAKQGTEPGAPARGLRQVVLAYQSAVYGLSLRGVELAAEVKIEAHRGPLPKLTLDLDSRLQFVGLSAGDQPLAWNPAAKPRNRGTREAGRRQIVAELPAPLQESALKLQIRAVSPLLIDESWKLPRIFVEGTVCRTSSVRLAVSSPLCIASLTMRGCRQTAVAALKPGGGEQLAFDLYDADAVLELSVTRPPMEIQAIRAATTEIGQGKMSSRVAADFHTSTGPVFQLEANVSPYWAIDTVASQPADAVDDWFVNSHGGARKLVVRLVRPLTAVRPLRLIIAARRLYAGGDPRSAGGRTREVTLKIDDVVPLHFAAPAGTGSVTLEQPKRAGAGPQQWSFCRLIDLRAVGGNELRVTGGDGTRRVDVKELTPAELDLCGYAQGDVLLREDAADPRPASRPLVPSGARPGYPAATQGVPRISLTHRGPSYAADIRVDAVVAGGTLEENYRFLCSSASAKPIDRLVVHFMGRGPTARAPVAPLTWSVDGLDATRFSVHRWTAAQESAAGLTAGEEAWDVTFGNRPATPVELHAVRKTKFAGPLPVCLASLPDAASQQAAVVVRSLGPQAVQVATRRVTPLPVEAVPAGQIQTVRAACRYDAREETAQHAEPAIVLSAVDRAAPPAWAWNGEILSRFAASGVEEHLITFNIENTGARQIVLKLQPANGCPPLLRSDIHDISINGKSAVVLSSEQESDSVAIELPVNARFVRLALSISTSGAPLAAFQRLQPPLADIGVPVLARRWSIELPPGYETLFGNGGAGAAVSYNPRQRLLGGLARGDEQRVFNPFRGGDWRSLLPRAEPLGNDDSAAHRPGTVAQRRVAEDRAAGDDDADDRSGWSRCSLELGDADPLRGYPAVAQPWSASVVAIHRPALAAAGWLLFLAIVGVGAWPRTGRPAALIVLAIICGMCALLLPAALATVFSCGLLGIGFCLALAIVRRPGRLRSGSAAEAPGTPASGSGPPELPSTLIDIIPYAAPVLALAVLCAAPAAAADVAADVAPAHSVFIPVNEKQHPTGGKYLVPEAFYSELYRRAAQHAEKPQGWLIAAAVYRAVLAEDASSSEYVVDRLTADYEIRVFDAAARVRIPLRREEISLVPGQALLDDRPVQPEWETGDPRAAKGDGALVLEIAEPGEYRLGLTLRPKVGPEGQGHSLAGRGFELAIPRVPGARLEVTVPTGGGAPGHPLAGRGSLTVPSAMGEVHWEEIPSRWVAQLGPAERLAMHWQDGTPGYPPGGSAAEALDVQQLQWLRVDPGCVLLDVRLKAKPSSGPIRRLQVKADASLELLRGRMTNDEGRMTNDEPASTFVIRHSTSPGGGAMQTFDIQLPRTKSADATVDLRFLWTGAAGVPAEMVIGTFRAPQIEVVGARPGRRWLAVSIDPSLEYQLPAGDPAPGNKPALFRVPGVPPDSAAVSEFISNWGGAPGAPSGSQAGEKAPDAAFRLNGNAAEWSMTTRVRKTETTGDVSTSWGFDAGNAQVLFDASLTSVGGNVFQYRLELPPELHVDSIAITHDGATVPARWHRGQDGRVAVFLAQGGTGRQRLQLRGQMPIPVKGKVPLPQLRLDDVHVQSTVVRLYRSKPVAVEVFAPPGLAEIKTPADEGHPFAGGDPELGLPVRAFYVDPAGATALSVALQPAPPQARPEAGEASSPPVRPPQSPGLPPGRGGVPFGSVVSEDVRVACQHSGRCVAAAALEVELPSAGAPGADAQPRVAADYPLWLPAGCELLCLTVDGVPVDVAPAPDGSCTVPISMSTARSRVELLFVEGSASTTLLSGDAGRATFQAPRLGDLPVQSMVWTIAAPPGLRLGSAEADGEVLAPAAAGDPLGQDRSGGLMAQWRQLAATRARVPGGTIATFTFNRRTDAIAVNFAAAPSHAWLARVASVAGFLAVTAFVAFLLRRAGRGTPWVRNGSVTDWLSRRPHACGIALGIAWWLWASPSALGLAIVFAVLVGQILAWHRRRRPFARRAAP